MPSFIILDFSLKVRWHTTGTAAHDSCSFDDDDDEAQESDYYGDRWQYYYDTMPPYLTRGRDKKFHGYRYVNNIMMPIAYVSIPLSPMMIHDPAERRFPGGLLC